ncbi:MAG TPA: permease [Acidimicrobiales bacterium]|nr:permease [Acidimicrobiales bacterium]
MTAAVAAALTAAGVLTDVGHSLREAFFMFWDTLWALVLGFALSGAVQAFVSRDQMRRRLGDHRPAAVARASVYGMVSSSCSYAASAMARSLVARGADFVAAMVFLFASTNLVVELGIVLLVLIGWQFLVAEFVGGAVMIVLLALLGGLWLRGRVLVGALETVRASGSHDETSHGDADAGAWRRRIRTRAGWADAAGYTMGDLTMLRREMVIGFVVAGFLTELVPVHVWSDVFLRGHGVWTSLENVVVAPLVAIVSFVCSIGNVPLAAALWTGGSSFGGVVAFVFADLVTLPLLLVYRKQYGGRMALRMLGLFWLVMSAAGLVTEYLFRAAGAVPVHRSGTVVGDTLRWNATTGLDIAAIVVFVLLYLLSRRRDPAGRFATDPMCGMQVDTTHAPARADVAGETVFFCSEHCRHRYLERAGAQAGR